MFEVSIIIPCFNHGHYLQEALNSIKNCVTVSYEVIIVDDGSNNSNTIQILNTLKEQGYKVLSQENKGLGAARNVGIKNAKGKYILPLDADNKVLPNYFEKGVELLKNNEADIVYGNPVFFGETNPEREFQPIPFDGDILLFRNFIDACAIYKREVWERLDGYSEDMPFNGYEDWEFWINAHKENFRFYFLKENAFYYRIDPNSMITSLPGENKLEKTKKYIYSKHALFIYEKLASFYTYKRAWVNERKSPIISGIKSIARIVSKK